ncbi:hypothetical protein B0H11DRAFT_2237656 [Mycena galericulata]|nr:hypothetical protein B0H11DRAFT_2237656 [Mycena galericulata]
MESRARLGREGLLKLWKKMFQLLPRAKPGPHSFFKIHLRDAATQSAASANSSKLRILGTQRKSASHCGRAPIQEQTLGPRAIAEYRRTGEYELRTRLQGTSRVLTCKLATARPSSIQDLAEDDDFDAGHAPRTPNFNSATPAGNPLERGIEEDTDDEGVETKAKKAEDWRTRRESTEIRNCVFQGQMPEMVAASEAPRPQPNAVDEVYGIQGVDMFGVYLNLELSSIQFNRDLRAITTYLSSQTAFGDTREKFLLSVGRSAAS